MSDTVFKLNQSHGIVLGLNPAQEFTHEGLVPVYQL